MQQTVDHASVNQLQVRAELQADCFAGARARHADQSGNFSKLANGVMQTPKVCNSYHPWFIGTARALVHDRVENGSSCSL